MHLGKLYSKFDSRCRSFYSRVNRIQNTRSGVETWEFNYLTETLVSDIWQFWCRFSRELFFSSCRGTTARNGDRILPRSGDLSWMRLGYEANQARNNRVPTVNGHLNFAMRKEPTWGDIDVFIKVVQTIRPTNYNTLISTYGSFTSLKDLQQVRNACAHKNVENMLGLSSLSTRYRFYNLTSATDVVWQQLRRSDEFAIELWLYEMNLIADYATSTS